MLLELTVENYAVVEKVRVRFHRGLNLLTGETGSGKSIVVDALALLLGGRAAAEMVRTGAERARIAGIFEVDATRAAGGRRAGRRRADHRARDSAQRQVAGLRGRASGDGGAAQGTGAEPGRYPRPARSAAVVFRERAARNAGRVRGRGRAVDGSRVTLRALERGIGRSWPSSTAPRRKSSARPTCGVFSATKSKR